mgnify:CR=1 FL=1
MKYKSSAIDSMVGILAVGKIGVATEIDLAFKLIAVFIQAIIVKPVLIPSSTINTFLFSNFWIFSPCLNLLTVLTIDSSYTYLDFEYT